MGAASISPVGGRNDPRWDRQRRARSTDFHLGAGIGVDAQGRDAILVSEESGNLLRVTERGELIVTEPESKPSQDPGVVSFGAPVDQAATNDALQSLADAINRVHDILREQEITA